MSGMSAGPARHLQCLALAWLAGTAVAGDPAAPQIHPQQWPQVAPALRTGPRLEAHLDALLGKLTPEQKVGQLIQTDIDRVTPQDLERYALGSVLNGGDSAPAGDKLAPPAAWLALADRLYDASVARGSIPVMWGTDAVHGDNNIPGATLFPQPIGLGCTHDPGLLRRIGAITALEVRVTGLDWTFAPVLAVTRDLRWGRTYESYSQDARIVRVDGAAMVRGLQGDPGTPQFLDAAHIIATAKHFLGDGATAGHDQGDDPDSEAELRDVDGSAYAAALAAGVQTVMASYSSWHGLKMHGNHALLTEVLKGRMGFDGLVISDWNGYAQLPGCTATSCPAAVNAGVDVLMAPNDWRGMYAQLLAQVRSGEIPLARLDDAVRRVLRVKLRARLLSEGRPSSRPFAGHFELLGAAAHRAVARAAVRESLVLLKNRAHLLPLAPRQRVLVAGDGADSLAMQSGGWTINWQGTEPNSAFGHAESIYAGIRAAVLAAGGHVELDVDGRSAVRPDVAVVVFGEHPYAEGAGDAASLAYSPSDRHELALLQRLHAQRIPVVAVFLSGRPMWVNAELNAADSFVAAWLPGGEGGGVADVLFRAPSGAVRYDFHGRLSFAWPRSPNVPAPGAALFAEGYGLTYKDSGELPQLPERAD